MRLETVERLTHDIDLATRHIEFLTDESDQLKKTSGLSPTEKTHLREVILHLSDCKEYLAQLEPQLESAITELAENIRKLNNKSYAMILFERYICLKPIRIVADELGLNLTAAYALHTQARDAYNALQGIKPYKDPRGRKKGTPSFG
jgi:hypothetical protein